MDCATGKTVRKAPSYLNFQQAIQANLLLNPGGLYDFQDNSALRLSYAYTTYEEFATAAEQLSQLIRRM